MRNYPKDKYDKKEVAQLNAEPWQLNLLKLNPSYTLWGPYEDYMGDKDAGWRTPVFLTSWKDMWQLDELNECVNFYFEVVRDNKRCEACDGEGYNPETKKISDDFYDFAGTGNRWVDKITQDEAVALAERGRVRTVTGDMIYKKKGKWYHYGMDKKPYEGTPSFPTAEEINKNNGQGSCGIAGHDAINRWILIETRAKRLGVYGKCPACGGTGYIYTADKATVNLILWMIMPRKGACRGVEIKNITQEDLPAIFKWLKEAKKRNNKRFGKIKV